MKANELYNKLVNMSSKSRSIDIYTGKYLYELKVYDLWRDSVGGIDRWEDFLKQPEVNISVSRANKLIKIYEFFVVKNKITDIDLLNKAPVSVLAYIVKKDVKDKDLIIELIENGINLKSSDFKEVVSDVVDGFGRTYTYMVMSRCNETGNLTKVHNIESDIIKKTFNLE